MPEPSLVRLYLLRFFYLLLFVGQGVQSWPQLLGGITERSDAGAVVTAMLSALSFVSIFGVIAPLRMLPVLLWEITWKVTWMLAVALPKWLAGQVDDALRENLFAVSFVIPFLFVFPWRWFFADLIARRDRWR